MGVRLPSAYQEVEYLESTRAGQYIDTLESVTNDIVVRAKFRFLTSYWLNYQSAFGAKGTSFDLQRGASSTTAFSVATFGTSVRVNVNYNIYQADTIAERSINSVTINGVTTALSVGQETPSGTIWLFGKESANKSAIDVAAGTRIYSAEILSGNIVLKHFIPCYRKSDDEAGLYDLVSGTFFTNAGTGEFVVGPDVIDSISPWLVARRRWIMAAASRMIKRIATGVNGVVNFVTKVKKPMKVTCEFSPVQEGTGDPSPDNVRPISGWTGCEITHTGKNLLDSSSLISGKYIDNNGHEQTNSSFGYTRPYSAILPNTTYILSGSWTHQHDYYCAVYFYDTNKEWIKRNTFDSGLTTYTFTTPENAGYIRVQYYKSLADAQVENGSTVTSFEPFQGYIIPVSFTDPTTGDPLIVYGGTLTLNEDGSVDLVSDVRFRTLVGTESWATEAETGTYNMKFKLNLSDMKYGSNITNALTNYIKRRESQAEGYNAGSLCIQFGWNDHRIFVLNATKDIADVSDLATWKAYLADHPLEIIYPLTTPTTYHFDNIGQLQSFLGNNAVWHDMNGQITVEYYNYQ